MAETCANLLRFTLPTNTLLAASTSNSANVKSNTEPYQPEGLPNALVVRLEGLALYAPFALQSLYHDAYAGTDGVRCALSGVGSSTYGVFDGLDYQNLFVPNSPPRKSPHKVHSDANSSGSMKMDYISDTGGFAVPQEAEEDEF